jgi:signal transduction histidine kinase
VASIRRNVELESRLISDLLDLTRISHGKLQLDDREVDLHLIVRSAVDICQREASAKLTVDLAASRHTVRGDSTRLQQVFWNLINNAIKFTPNDGDITVRSSSTEDGRIRVEVIDSGVGIDVDVLPDSSTPSSKAKCGPRANRPAWIGVGDLEEARRSARRNDHGAKPGSRTRLDLRG